MAEVTPASVTVRYTMPAVPAGDVAVEGGRAEKKQTVAGLEPKSTTAPLAKPVPVTVTDVPPAVGPVVGLTELTVGTAS